MRLRLRCGLPLNRSLLRRTLNKRASQRRRQRIARARNGLSELRPISSLSLGDLPLRFGLLARNNLLRIYRGCLFGRSLGLRCLGSIRPKLDVGGLWCLWLLVCHLFPFFSFGLTYSPDQIHSH